MGSEFFTTENTQITEIFKGFLRVLCALRGEALKEAHRVSYSAVSSTVTCVLLKQSSWHLKAVLLQHTFWEFKPNRFQGVYDLAKFKLTD